MSNNLYIHVGPYLCAELPEGVSAYDILSEKEDVFTICQPDENARVFYFLPNENRDGFPMREMTFDKWSNNPAYEIQAATISEESEWFLGAYVTEIGVIQAKCPDHKVGWGVVPYWM